MIEIKEIIYQWQQGVSQRQISRNLGVCRRTVRKVMNFCKSHGLEGSGQVESKRLEEVCDLYRKVHQKSVSKNPHAQENLKAHHEQLGKWLEEPHMTVVQIGRLLEEKDQQFSETTLRRYIKKHFPTQPVSTVPLPSLAGHQAQVDFASVGKMVEASSGKKKTAYAFIMTLSYSRYRYVRFVFNQDSATWIDCHIRAFHFFGGVPLTILLDNLKAGVILSHIYDPILNRSYGELARHYGFVIDPCKVRVPRHKGKVERSVQLVRQQVLAGREFKDIEEANTHALKWCRETLSQVVCRSTGQTPWERFSTCEKSHLKPLPQEPFDQATWKEVKVHKDHHVVFEGSYYSVPTSYIGKQVWVRGGCGLVTIYHQDKRIKTHPRALHKGTWTTDTKDYPEKARSYLEKDKEWCLRKAQTCGHSVHQLIQDLLQTPTGVGQRKAQAILRLTEIYGEGLLDKACKRALHYDNTEYKSLKSMLQKGLDSEDASSESGEKKPLLEKGSSYLRSFKGPLWRQGRAS